jgi:aromatic-L-amino-acid decarboxylase
MQAGLELADSYCFNAHKWMFTNFDCTCFYVADRKVLIDTLTILPEYLKNAATASGAVIDYRDWQVSLGRRFRALKLWFVIRHYGVTGLQALIRQHVALAEHFIAWVRADDRFELAAPPSLTLICIRHRDGDSATQQILEKLNTAGEIYLTGTKLAGRYAIRFNIGQTRTEEHHVRRAWELLQEQALKQ